MIFLLRGYVIFFVETLRDYFLWRGCVIFLWRGCMIFFCVERLRDNSHSLTHSLTRVALFIIVKVA